MKPVMFTVKVWKTQNADQMAVYIEGVPTLDQQIGAAAVLLAAAMRENAGYEEGIAEIFQDSVIYLLSRDEAFLEVYHADGR